MSRAAQPGRARLPDRARGLPLRRLPPGLPLLGLPRPGRRPVQPAAALLEDDRRPGRRRLRPHLRLQPRLRAADPAAGPGLPEPEGEARSGASAGWRSRTGWRGSAGGRGSTPASGSGRRSAAAAAPISGYQTYDSYPFLRLGSKGDLVAWAQQLLAGGGYSTPITGYFEAPTRTAVLRCRRAKGLPQTGAIDVPTWDVLLTFDAAGGALDQGRRRGRVRRGAGRCPSRARRSCRPSATRSPPGAERATARRRLRRVKILAWVVVAWCSRSRPGPRSSGGWEPWRTTTTTQVDLERAQRRSSREAPAGSSPGSPPGWRGRSPSPRRSSSCATFGRQVGGDPAGRRAPTATSPAAGTNQIAGQGLPAPLRRRHHRAGAPLRRDRGRGQLRRRPGHPPDLDLRPRRPAGLPGRAADRGGDRVRERGASGATWQLRRDPAVAARPPLPQPGEPARLR